MADSAALNVLVAEKQETWSTLYYYV